MPQNSFRAGDPWVVVAENTCVFLVSGRIRADLAAQKLLGRTCGVFGEPAGVTGTAAVKKACELGLIEKGATVVSVVTGNGLKDVANAIKSAGEPINIKPDLDLMVEEFAKRGVTVE